MICTPINNNFEANAIYQSTLRFVFSKLDLKFSANEINIALMDDGRICGGITLEKFDSLYDDPDIQKHWFIQKDIKAVKMKRLWLNHKNSKIAQLKIFEAVTIELRGNEFLYGLLSFRLAYAQKLSKMLVDVKDVLAPKIPIENCDWDPNIENSSDGHKIIKSYLAFGAYPLGQMSGCEEDSSVRMVMGINYQDFDIKSLWSRYA